MIKLPSFHPISVDGGCYGDLAALLLPANTKFEAFPEICFFPLKSQ